MWRVLWTAVSGSQVDGYDNKDSWYRRLKIIFLQNKFIKKFSYEKHSSLQTQLHSIDYKIVKLRNGAFQQKTLKYSVGSTFYRAYFIPRCYCKRASRSSTFP